MHILLVHQYFLEDNDGGGSRWNEMARIWVNEGHRVTVLAGMGHYMHATSPIYAGKYFVKKINCDGVKVVRCFVANDSKSIFWRRLWSQFSFVLSAICAGIFYCKDKYDVVLCTSPPLFVGIAGMFIAWKKSIDLILEIRDLWPESAIETGILKNRLFVEAAFGLEKLLYHRAKAINVLTPAFKAALIHKKHVDAHKIWLIPNAADFMIPEKLQSNFDKTAFRKSLGLDERFIIIYVGAHGIANHLVQLIAAAEILRETNAHFMLIGDGPEKAMLITETKRRKLDNVTFLDTVSKAEVFKYILAADAGASVLKKADVFKTVYSNKTFDYFACSKPVLVAIDGISRHLIEEANAGLFVEPENPDDFAKKVLTYLANPTLAALHGSNGYAHAKQHYDRAFLARKYLEYIQNMLQTNSLQDISRN
ncbi:glycosyltransferase family 4 protein [Dyadobacter sp. CY326]|uniref:glycosyltransferase family 4 protein n=1 Tax=Dyadobacter sp. CY326 TaxID=2907300 RepID=UPI001F1E62E3|nr:glycosyltransferase family 4 protein [Dyadobacter sp. CY326]MCE7068413.1 glycosyltransferase family 4 protein [Dyadobacter sp. CY326]